MPIEFYRDVLSRVKRHLEDGIEVQTLAEAFDVHVDDPCLFHSHPLDGECYKTHHPVQETIPRHGF
ncbi:hypothetical protein M011DRAFT_470889 [Sporormia fimetaria CBS 119925]|uniref:Uncharacterized protein n=1 Tax=Sporormia fimetaria CBS 119925 TaxID=1340428 RepID=A0A6A6V1T6_9PLEO|nr:hypothetical protein M011DRAFT_470889 [Sporormia fimetaria CBS 119925]